VWLGTLLMVFSGIGIRIGIASGYGGGGHSIREVRTSGHGGAPSASKGPSGRQYPSVSLAGGDLFDQIAVSGNGLLLTGETHVGAGSLSPTCVTAAVEPTSLALTKPVEVDCDDPAAYGQTVGEVNNYIVDSNNATISIARLDPQTGNTLVGPVVMTYASYSDTRPVTTYGGGWFWIYDNSTITTSNEVVNENNPGIAQLLQVSTSTGEVVNTVEMPKLYRPVMAANDEGLWIGNSVEGGTCAGCAPPSALYFVAPGSADVQVAIADTGSVTCWLLGASHQLWAGIGGQRTGCGTQSIWRFDGTDFRPAFMTPDDGYHPNEVIGNESDGLWTSQWISECAKPCSSRQEIVRIDPDTGSEGLVAMLPALPEPWADEAGQGLVAGQAVVFAGSLYILEPPFELNGYLGYSTLVRVPLH